MQNELVFHMYINECCIRIFAPDGKGQSAFTIQDLDEQTMIGEISKGKNTWTAVADAIYRDFLTKILISYNTKVLNNECYYH